MELEERAVFAALSRDEKLALLREASRYLNRFGVTSVVNAIGSLAEIELYAALRDRGELTVRTRNSFGAVAVKHHLTSQFLSELDQARTKYNDDWVSANLVKFFADGGSGMFPPLTYEPADYKKLVLELDKRGFQIMTHALRGDAAHMVLDTYELVAKANGQRDRRFRMEHGEIFPTADLPRFAKLSVLISTQPSFCCSDIGSNFDPQDKTPTDRWHSLLQSGAGLAYGSDWPCTFPPDPFVAIQQLVRRQVWKSATASAIVGGVFDGAGQGGAVPTLSSYIPEERLTVEQVIQAYTLGSAFARFSEDKLGSLEVGKEADLAFLSQERFTAPLARSLLDSAGRNRTAGSQSRATLLASPANPPRAARDEIPWCTTPRCLYSRSADSPWSMPPVRRYLCSELDKRPMRIIRPHDTA
jgi:predicted amidohydrolase YtcJ